MATLGATKVTLADWAKTLDPSGRTAKIVEMLAQTNELFTDMPMVMGNLPTGHRTTIRTGLPTAIFRKLYQGVPTSKSTRAQVTESIGMLETRCEIDKDLAELNGNTAEFRLGEATPFMEAMAQTAATTVVYGDTDTDPEKFMGLAPRFSSLSAVNGQNIINGGGSGSDQSSIWLICWGEDTCHGIFPKGSMAGIQHEDLGLADAFDADNNRYRAYMDHWQLKLGMVVRDWRYVVRIANIDMTQLVAEATDADLVKLMIRAMHRLPSQALGRCKWYMNRRMLEWLDIQSAGKSASGSVVKTNVVFDNQNAAQGKMVQSFRGVPIGVCDAILNTEAAVS